MFSKRKSSALLVISIFAIAGNLLNIPAASAASNFVEGTDKAAAMFNPLEVNNFSLQMSDADFESLRYPNVSWDNEGDWRETRMTFTMGGKNYGPYTVGVHLKGAWGSHRDVSGKAAFKIKMDAFVPDQTLFGVSKITLNNMVQDPSYIHETLTYRLYRALGVPTPRTGYANVSLNGISYGLHLNIETMNKELLSRWGISSKHLYKGAVPYFPDFVPGAEPYFAIESGSKTDVSDLTGFININKLVASSWWNSIQLKTDMKITTLSWAAEMFVGHWDGYLLNRNNYFLNFDNQGKVLLLPWGTDQTWGSGYNYFSSQNILARKCWVVPACYAMYQQAMVRVAKVAEQIKLDDMAVEVGSAIRSAIISDRFSSGIRNATDAQNWTIWTVRNQLASLKSQTSSWDADLESISVNGISYTPGQTMYLAPGTTVIDFKVKTSNAQANANYAIRPLKTGLNIIDVVVTSADGKHNKTTQVNLHLYTSAKSSGSIAYSSNKISMTSSGSSSSYVLASRFVDAKDLVLNIKMAKNKKLSTAKNNLLLKQRTDTLLKYLDKKGIKPTKVTKSLTSVGSVNALSVTATYVK